MLLANLLKVNKVVRFWGISLLILCASACASTSTQNSALSDRITQAEAMSMACPPHILKAGASESDCSCVHKELYALGQKQGVLSSQQVWNHEASQGGNAGREVAIGVLRLTAFETCGLFDPDHPVSQNLGEGDRELNHSIR